MLNFSNWKNLNCDSTEAKGQAYSRLSWLMLADPFVSMLSPHVRDALPPALYNGCFRDDGTFWKYSHPDAWNRRVRQNIEATPYSKMWTDEFKNQLRILAVDAVWPEAPVGESDG